MARKKDTPQKAALREMMGNYLKELHKSNRVKCSHLSFLAREDEVKCLHSLLIIMEYFLGQHNPLDYFALTIDLPVWRFILWQEKRIPHKKQLFGK